MKTFNLKKTNKCFLSFLTSIFSILFICSFRLIIYSSRMINEHCVRAQLEHLLVQHIRLQLL